MALSVHPTTLTGCQRKHSGCGRNLCVPNTRARKCGGDPVGDQAAGRSPPGRGTPREAWPGVGCMGCGDSSLWGVGAGGRPRAVGASLPGGPRPRATGRPCLWGSRRRGGTRGRAPRALPAPSEPPRAHGASGPLGFLLEGWPHFLPRRRWTSPQDGDSVPEVRQSCGTEDPRGSGQEALRLPGRSRAPPAASLITADPRASPEQPTPTHVHTVRP